MALGIAKPSPWLPPDSVRMKVFTPTSRVAMQHDLHAPGAGDDMRVGNDVAVGIDGRAGPDCALPSDHQSGVAAARGAVDGTVARVEHLHHARRHTLRERFNRCTELAQEAGRIRPWRHTLRGNRRGDQQAGRTQSQECGATIEEHDITFQSESVDRAVLTDSSVRKSRLAVPSSRIKIVGCATKARASRDGRHTGEPSYPLAPQQRSTAPPVTTPS